MQDDEIRGELKRALGRLEEGKQSYEEIAGAAPDKLVDAVAMLDRAALERIVLWQLVGQRLAR